MVKIFLTGDNHFGRKHDRFPDIKDKLLEARFQSLEDMVRTAEAEACELFVVAGDLFDSISTVRVGDVKRAASILAAFSGTVLVLPGNHDFYTGEEKVWQDFEKALSSEDHNIVMLNEYREYTFDVGEEKVVVYPAFCQSKHGKENNLAWIKTADINRKDVINIGIAHGAIKGVSPDQKEEYFLMTEDELNAIPVDAWLIGHTHIIYPANLLENSEAKGYKIFNAGTHEQTDWNNSRGGYGMILTIDKSAEQALVAARAIESSRIHFHEVTCKVSPDGDDALAVNLETIAPEIGKDSVLRLFISGVVKKEEYENRKNLYEKYLGDLLYYEVDDSELSEEITLEKLRSEYAETSFASQFMEALLDEPVELQMAYQLVRECKESK